jgi:hypothetical protein
MSWRGHCQSCDKEWIFEVNDFPNKIKQCVVCKEAGYPARLILDMAVHPCELESYDEMNWPVQEWQK